MSAPVNANINVLINTSQATAQLRSLQAQIAATNKSIGAGSGAAAAQQAALSKALMDGANASRMWNARVVPMSTATQQFSEALDRGRMSLGQYTRYASSQLPGMSRIFRREFDMMSRVAEQNVRRMQTQYVALGNSATGAAQAMAMTPTALNKQAAASQIAAQRQMMMNRMIDLGSTKLLNWGKNTQWAGRQLMVGFSIPLAMMGAAAAKAFKEIDKAEISFKRVYGSLETTTEEMERNLDAVKALGEEYTKYGKSMASTIEIASRVAATGATGEALTAGTEQTIRLATLGLMEYDEALDATIALQTAFQVSNEDLASTIDFLNVVENETILTMQDMAAAIPRVAPVVRGLGGDVKDLAVFMTAMREGGVTAEQGANALKSGLGRLINPTKAAREEMAKYGISIEAITQKNKGDLMATITEFGQALSSLGDFEQQQVLQKVFGTYQYARLGALFKNIANDSGQAARAIELTSMSVEDLARISDKELSKIEEATSVKFQAAIEKLKIAIAPIGETFLKILTPVIDIVTKIADKFNNLPDNIKNAITIAIAAIAGIGPVLLMVVGLFANGIANVVKFVQMLRKFFARLKGDSSAFGYLAQKEQEAAAAAAGLSGATDNLTGKFVGQQRALERLIELLSIYSSRLGSVAGMPVPGAVAGGGARVAPMPVPMKGPRTFFTPMGRPKGYADGVVGVPGTGNKDTVPALLTPGESVVTKDATKQYGSIISAMNAGTIKMMATAGGATGSELPPARSMTMMGGASNYYNPGAFMLPGNQTRFGMDPALLSTKGAVGGITLQQAILGNLVGAAQVVEKELGTIKQNARMSRSYFETMARVVGPAATGIADDIQDVWKNMSDADRQSSNLDDVIARAKPRIEQRLAALEQTGPRGAAAAAAARRMTYGLASPADMAKYAEIRSGAVERKPDGTTTTKPYRVRHSLLESPIATATKYARAYDPSTGVVPRSVPALPRSLEYAHGVGQRVPAPAQPLSGAGLAASPAIRSDMFSRLLAYQKGNPMYTVTPQMEADMRAQMAKLGTVGATTFTTTLKTESVAGSKSIMPAVVHQGMGHSANPLFGEAAKADARLYTTTLKAEVEKAKASGFRNPNLIPRGNIAGPGVESLNGVRVSTRDLASALIATLGDAKTHLVAAFRQIPAFASQVLIAIQPIFAKLTEVFLQLNPWIGKAAQSIRHFFTQLSYTWMGIRSVGWEKLTSIARQAKSAFETAQIASLIAWDKVKGLPARAKSAYETAMLKTMMGFDSIKRMPAQMTNMVSTFMSDLPRSLQRLRNQVFYRGQDLKGRLAERFAPIKDAITRGAGIAANPVPRAIAIATAGMMAQEKLTSAVARASQAFDPIRSQLTQFGQSISSAAQFVSRGFQLLADPLGRAVVVSTLTKAALEKLNAALGIARQKLAPIGKAFNSVVTSVRGAALKISKVTQLLMDPLGRAVVLSTLSNKMQGAFSNAVQSVKVGATKLYESLLWGAAKSIIGFENAVAKVRTGLSTAFNTAVQSVRAGATKLYESLLWGSIKAITGLESAFNSIKTRTSAKWNEVLAAFRSVNLKQAFIDAGNSIKGAARGGAEGIKASLISAGQSIRDAGRIAGAMVAGAGATVSAATKGVSGWLAKTNERTGQTRGQRMGGAANSAVMGLMGVSMAASFLQGELGEMAQKIMPVTMGLMGLQMLLPMLKTPFGLAIVAIGALTAMFVKTRMDLDKFARSAAEAGANLGGVANRLSEMSAATGYTFASQRAKDRLFRIDTDQKESMSQFAEYFESERGQKFLDNLRNLTSADRYKEVAKMISMAIADGMDEETAKAYGYSVAYYLNDAVMQQKLKLDFAAGNFADGIDNLIDIIAERQNAIDALGGYNPVEVGQSGASRALANRTGIGKYNTQQSMFAEGVAKTGLVAGAGALALGGGMAAAGIGTAMGATAISGLVAGAAMTSWAGPLAIVGAIAGAAIGGIIAWKQYNDQVAKLNENVGSAAMMMGNAIQVLGELEGAEQLLIEKRRDGAISAQEYADQLQRIKDIEARAMGNMRSVIESMMMGGEVDTGALQQAMKSQLIFADFEEGLAGAISSTITPENIAKSLFPGNTLEEVFQDVGKRAAVTEVMIQSLAGITPDNAKQRLADITTQWAVVAQELVVAAEDGLTPDEARAILAGKRAAQIIMDAMMSGAEGEIENAALAGTPEDYATARDIGGKALSGESYSLPEGTTVETQGGRAKGEKPDTAIVTQGGREYQVTKKRDIADRILEKTPGATDTVDINNVDLKDMFQDLDFTESDRQKLKDTSGKLGYGTTDMSQLFIDQMSNRQNAYATTFRQNIEKELAKAAEDANYDLSQVFGGLGLGETSNEIRDALQRALDTAAANLESPYLVTDLGPAAERRAEASGQAYTDYAATRTDVTNEEAEVGLAAATTTLGVEGLENITEDTEKLKIFFDLLAKMNSPEFAGMDLGKAMSDVFGEDASANVATLTKNLNDFDSAYSGVGEAFGDNSQKVIDYFKETAEASKDSGETVDEYVNRQVDAAKGYAETIKGMPTDLTSKLGIDIEDPSTFMDLGPYLEQIMEMWPILQNLNPDIDLRTVVENLVTENGKPATMEKVVDNVQELNSLQKKLDKAKDKKARQNIIIEMATQYTTEGEPGSADRESAAQAIVDNANELLSSTGKTIDELPAGSASTVLNITSSLRDTLAGLREDMAKAKAEEAKAFENLMSSQSASNWDAYAAALAKVKGIDEEMAAAEKNAAATIASLGMNAPPLNETGGSTSGGGGKESPLKGFKEDILNLAKLWTDATMNMEKLNNAKMSFAEQVLKGDGIFNKLRKIKGLPTDAIRQIMEMGPEGSEEFIKKFTKGGKLTAAGKGFLEAQTAGRINEMLGEDRLTNIDTKRRTKAARSLMRQEGVSTETFNFIAEDTERLDAYWELKKRANKGDKEAAKDLEKFIRIQSRKVKLEQEFNDSLLTGVQLARQQLDEYAAQQNAFFDKQFADIEKQADIEFETNYGMSVAEMEYQIKLNEDLIDGHRDSIEVLNDEIRVLETRNGTAKDYSDWGLEQIQKEISANQDLIKGYERQNELTQRRIDNLKRQDELRNRVSEELSHDLDIMSDAETKINEAYDKRIEALDAVENINQRIIEQQQQQLNLSQALSQGDIYAATAAAQEMQASSIQFASDQVRSSLEQGRENEIAGLRTAGGLTREQAEKQIADIKEQSYQTSLQTRILEDEIYNRNLNDILPLKDKEYTLNKALESVQDAIAAKQLSIRDIERSKIEPLTRQNELMREQIDDHLLNIEGKQMDIKNAAGQTRDEFERMNNWLQADLAWQEAMTEETERAEQKARDLALMWKNVGKQIQNAKDTLTKDFKDINVRPLGEDYTEEDRQRDLEAAQKKYDDAVAGELAAATAATTTNNSGLVTTAFAGGLMKKKYANGGFISGSGARDSVPAILSPGEFVVRKAMVDKYGMPMFNAINQGAFSMPRYNTQTPSGNVRVKTENNTNVVAPMYNNYSVNVSVSNSNASADDIANKAIMKIRQMNDMQIRGNRGY